MIEARGLVKRYGDFTAVKGIDLEVREGEIFGFLGPNGAGKSTTIKMLTTIVRLTDGLARVAGHDVAEETDAVRSALGIVFQDPTLDIGLSAWENLYLHGMLYGLSRAAIRERAHAVLAMMELQERRKDLVKTFSGGMKRRLEIARGLMHRPKVLFLDEPTVGLDPQTRARIWDYVKSLRDENGLTIFMTTHYMDEAEHCDRIAIMDQGEIIALDTPDNLKRSVGNDVITLQTEDDEQAIAALSTNFSITARSVQGGVQFDAEDGEMFLPQLLARNLFHVTSLNLRKPTLDDVFMLLTGRTIREEDLSARDQLRETFRQRRNQR